MVTLEDQVEYLCLKDTMYMKHHLSHIQLYLISISNLASFGGLINTSRSFWVPCKSAVFTSYEWQFQTLIDIIVKTICKLSLENIGESGVSFLISSSWKPLGTNLALIILSSPITCCNYPSCWNYCLIFVLIFSVSLIIFPVCKFFHLCIIYNVLLWV